MKYLLLLLLLVACTSMPTGFVADTELRNLDKELQVAFDSRVFDYNEEGFLTKLGKNLGFKNWNNKTLKIYDYTIHHDAQFLEDKIIFLSHEIGEYEGINATFDIVYLIDLEGNELASWHTYDHITELESLGFGAGEKFSENIDCETARTFCFEFSHLNSIDVMNNGDWLISDRTTSKVFSINPRDGSITWILPDSVGVYHQHSVRQLSNGNILLFDNGEKASRAIELDSGNNIVWQYPKELTEEFYSSAQGHVQRLKNGNTLITSSFQGLIVEVSPDAEIVWEYHSEGKKLFKGMKLE